MAILHQISKNQEQITLTQPTMNETLGKNFRCPRFVSWRRTGRLISENVN